MRNRVHNAPSPRRRLSAESASNRQREVDVKERTNMLRVAAAISLAMVVAAAVQAGESNHETVVEKRPLALLRLEFAPHRSPPVPEHKKASYLGRGLWSGDEAPGFAITLFCRGDAVTGGYGLKDGRPPRDWDGQSHLNAPGSIEYGAVFWLYPTSVLTEHLQLVDGRLTGLVGLDYPWFWREYAVEARISGAKVDGTFTYPKAAAGETWRLTGRYIAGDDLAELRRAQRLDPRAEWPNWRGPTHDGRVSAPDPDLVDHMKDAQLLWCSEVQLPGGGGGVSHGQPGAYGADFNGPLVADGRVIFAAPERSAESPACPGYAKNPCFHLEGWDQRSAELRRHVDHFSAIIMDDVVYGLDAATGATLWRTTFHARGLSGNLNGKSKEALWSTGVLTDEAFYCMGESGWLYCLDPASGAVRWESREANPKRIGRFEASLAEYRAGKIDLSFLKEVKVGRYAWAKREIIRAFGNAHQVQCSLALVDGVLVCESDGGLAGMDPAIGRRLWGPVPDVLFGSASPFPWSYQGRSYVMTGRACLDPHSGKVLWKYEESGSRRGVCSPVVLDDILVMSGIQWSSVPMRAYRITPSGRTSLWTCDQIKGPAFSHATVDPEARRLYFKNGHGDFVVVDADTGKVLGQEKIANKIWGGQFLAMGGTRLLDGEMRMVAVSPDGGIDYRGSFCRLRYTCTTPALADGRVFIRTKSAARIACYDLRKGR